METEKRTPYWGVRAVHADFPVLLGILHTDWKLRRRGDPLVNQRRIQAVQSCDLPTGDRASALPILHRSPPLFITINKKELSTVAAPLESTGHRPLN